MSDIAIVGGVGGTHARTEDLARMSALLDGARQRMEGVASWARLATADLRSRQWADAIVARHAESALDWVNLGLGGADAVAREVDEISRGLAETVRLLEGAERGAGRLWDGLWATTQRVLRLDIAAVQTVARGGSGVATRGPLLGPEGPSRVSGTSAPATTALLDSAEIEMALAMGNAVPLVPVLFGWSAAELLTFCLGLSALGWSGLLGDPHGLAIEESDRHITSPPSGAADLIERVGDLYPTEGEDLGVAHVAVECIEHQDGTRAWIVEIPGTQSFVPNGGSNPFDITADLQSMSGQTSDVLIAVTAAMRAAGIPRGDPVMLVGHSLGGIGAMGLASNESFTSRYNVRSVVTAGSPVARFAPSGDTSILSLENSTDIVWALDGAPNPDRAEWITVKHDLRGSDNPLDRAGSTSIVGSHEAGTYVRTAEAFDSASGSTAAAWRHQNAAFLADGTTVSIRTTYDISRGAEGAPIVSAADGG